MPIQPQNVLNDWFEAAQIATINFQVFISDPAQILRAAAAMRCEDPRVLCHAAGPELWVFENGQPKAKPPGDLGLKLTEQGSLPPSAIAAKPELVHYLGAVRESIVAHFASSVGYIPFGNALYDLSDGSLVHIVPALTLSGVLHIKVTRELADLRPVTEKSTPIVYIAPLGRLARLMDASVTPSPALVEELLEFLSMYYYLTPPPQLSEDLWVQVACDGREFLWPQSLVLTCQQIPLHLGWLNWSAWETRLQEQTTDLEQSEGKGGEGQGQAEGYGPNLPPPATSPPHKTPRFEPPATFLMPPLPPLPPPPPTPLNHNEGTYLTPLDNSPEKRHPEQDDDRDEDDEWEGHVTLDDFNYFDTPIPKETPAPILEPEPILSKRPPNPLHSSPNKRAIGRFAPLEVASDMDYKYSQGGRYFMPPHESSSSSSSSSSSEDSDSDMSVDFEAPPSKVPDPWSFVVDADTHVSPRFDAFPLEQLPQTEKWLGVMLDEQSAPVQSWPMDCIAELLKQVVWDDGHTFRLCEGILGHAQHVPVSPFFIKQVYPAAQMVSLADLSHSGLDVPSRPATPAFPGVEDPQAQAQQQVQQQQQQTPNNFTLLSPPLYLISRMKQLHKARAAILRFWQPFGLQPVSGPRDITVVHIGLKTSHRFELRRRLMNFAKYTYEQCELGQVTFANCGPIKDGFFDISADIEYVSPDTLGELFESACVLLKRHLSSAIDSNARVLVVMSWPATQRASVLPAIRGYLALKSGFPNIKLGLYTRELECIYVQEQITQMQAVRWALQWYDRWLPRYATTASSEEPAFKLAQLVPQNINLKYDGNAPSQMLEVDPTMHLAYVRSACGRFVAAAWSDQWAGVTRIEAFLVVNDLARVLREMWERTAFLCGQSPNKSEKWRIAIVKRGTYTRDELDSWLKVASGNFLMLCIPHSPLFVGGENLFVHERSKESRDQVIVDSMDETHGIMFERKLYGSALPVAAVGVLIKPWRDGHQQLQVDLVHGTSITKGTAKQILGQFRRLASLSETAGVSQGSSICPWHVEAVAKMSVVLATL